jgi:hypothetical protein
MDDSSKKEREIIYPILHQLHFDTKTKAQLDCLMAALGFDDDVNFAKSLLSDRISKIYQHHSYLTLYTAHNIRSSSQVTRYRNCPSRTERQS